MSAERGEVVEGEAGRMVFGRSDDGEVMRVVLGVDDPDALEGR